jgi:hypothetical protein
LLEQRRIDRRSGKKKIRDMKQKRILVPTQSAQDWKRLLAEPEKHWKPGYSAMLMAQAWENADGLPNEIMAAFNASPDDYFGNLGLVLAIPEYKISLQVGTSRVGLVGKGA